MPIYTAPGVYYTIQDLSQYAAPISISTCGCVGAATKGPITGDYNVITKTYNTPRLITSPEEFVRIFGIPDTNYQGPYAALLYLQQGNQLYYSRVAVTNNIKKVDSTDVDLIANREYIVVSTSGDAGTVQYNGVTYGPNAAGGDRFEVDPTITRLSSVDSAFVIVNSAKAASRKINDNMVISASSKGSWGNEIGYKIRLLDVGTDSYATLIVYERVDGEAIERESFANLSINPRNENYWGSVVNKGSSYVSILVNGTISAQPNSTGVDENGNEKIVWLNDEYNTLSGSDETAANTELSYFEGQESYVNTNTWKTKNGAAATWIKGSDGQIPTQYDAIGTPASEGVASGLYAFEDNELTDISILMIPGYTEAEVLSTMNTIITKRADCFGLLHTPLGKNVQESVDWHNGKLEGVQSVRISNPYIGMYFPWAEIYDPYNKTNVLVPPVGFAAQAMAYTDNVAYPWFAPAGIQRGVCAEALRLEFNATQGQRELMYGPGNGNALNPLVNLPLDGIAIYGQRTMQRTASALDRIDVARMMIYMAKVLKNAVRPLVFEKNDELLWNRFKLIVNPFIAHIKASRGVEEFKVVCDASTNTPYIRNNNEMHGYILLIPTKTAEKIVMNFCLYPSGSSLELPTIG